MEINNPFKIGDIVYHYSTKEDQLIISCFSDQHGIAYVQLNARPFSTSESKNFISPIARFEPTSNGWHNACIFASTLTNI